MTTMKSSEYMLKSFAGWVASFKGHPYLLLLSQIGIPFGLLGDFLGHLSNLCIK